MQIKSKITINFLFLLYLIYTIFIWLCDAFDYACYQAHIAQVTWISRVIAISFLSIIIFLFKSNFKIEKKSRMPAYYVIIVFIIIYSIIKGLIPDLSADVSLLHFPNLFPQFLNNIDENVFPYGMVTFLFPLNDRIFYYFYSILGYRMGTLLNAFVIILTYMTTIDILELLKGKSKQIIEKKVFSVKNAMLWLIRPEIFSFIIVFSFYISMNIGMYMVDMIPMPIIMQVFKCLVESLVNRETAGSKEQMLYVALLSGICFAMKLTNVVAMVPLVLLYLWINRKKLSAKILGIGTMLACIPPLPYLLYSYFSTGSPVYPFYNTIFRSTYYPLQNFKDARWGPQGFWQTIFWPLQPVFRPSQRLSELAPIGQCAIFIGLLSSVGLFIILFRERRLKTSLCSPLIILYITQTYFWIITTGYARYAVYLEIFSGILTFFFINKIIKTNKFISQTLSFLLISAFIIQFITGQYLIIYKGVEWAWRPPILRDLNSYIKNIKYAFKDLGPIGLPEQRAKIDAIIQVEGYGNLNYLIAPKGTERINRYYLQQIDMQKINSDYYAKSIQKIYDLDQQGKGLYCAIPNYEYQTLAQKFNDVGLTIKKIEIAPSYFEPNYYVLLINVGMASDYENKLVYVDSPDNSFQISAEENKGQIRFSGIMALAPYVSWNNPTTICRLEATDGKTTKVLFEQEIDILEFYPIDVVLDVSGFTGDITLKFSHVDISGNPTDWNYMTIVNPEFIVEDNN